jgi:DNA-binding XRE family transcriptional regulator
LHFYHRTIRVVRASRAPLAIRGIPIPKSPATIGGHLRRRRAELRLGQSQASYSLGISTVTLSRWECDKVFPTASYHPHIVAYLGYDPFKTTSKSA